MKNLFLILSILGMLCAACGGSTAQSDSHSHEDGTTHVHSADCDQKDAQGDTVAGQERFVADGHECDKMQAGECDHKHSTEEEAHSHDGSSAHTH